MKEGTSKDRISGEFEKLYKKVSKKDILRAVEESDKIYQKVAKSSVFEKEIA